MIFAVVAPAGTSMWNSGGRASSAAPDGEMSWSVRSWRPDSASRIATTKQRPWTAGSRVTLIWLKTPIADSFPSCAVSA